MNGSTVATGCPLWSFTTKPFEFLGYCLFAGGQYPFDAFSPDTYDGTTVNEITDGGYAGEYSVVNVIAGQTYQFLSSEPDLITISSDGTNAEAFGVSAVTWTFCAFSPSNAKIK